MKVTFPRTPNCYKVGLLSRLVPFEVSCQPDRVQVLGNNVTIGSASYS